MQPKLTRPCNPKLNFYHSQIYLHMYKSSSYGKVSMIQFRHKKRIRTEGLSFYHPNLLCCLGQMLAVMELNQHLVLSSKTVRHIIPQDGRCMGYVQIMWSAVCSLAPHLHFTEEARPHCSANRHVIFHSDLTS